MESKDNRSKSKRNKMSQHNRYRGKANTKFAGNATSSSSNARGETVRGGIADVADSSDDRFCANRGWLPHNEQRRRSSISLEFDDNADLDDIENAQMRAADFDQMSQLPRNVGSHFQFSNEKHWETPEGEQLLDNTEASEYFTLNVRLLNAGLQTIPFHKRMDYASSLFTREQLLSMEKAAEIAEVNYQNILKEHETNPRIQINSGSKRSTSAKSVAAAKAAPSVAANEPDELDELLNMTTTQVTKTILNTEPATSISNDENTSTANVVTDNKDDIQQWLDNVLEE